MQACPVVLAVLFGRCYAFSTCPFSEVKPGYDCSGYKKDLCLDGVCVNNMCSKYSIDNIEKSILQITSFLSFFVVVVFVLFCNNRFLKYYYLKAFFTSLLICSVCMIICLTKMFSRKFVGLRRFVLSDHLYGGWKDRQQCCDWLYPSIANSCVEI